MSRVFLLTFLMVFSTTLYSSEITLKIEGLSGDLKKNVDIRLSTVQEQLEDTGFRSKFIAFSEIKKALRAKGYYNPKMTFGDSSDPSVLVINIDPGEPVLIETVNFRLKGDGETDPEYIALGEKYHTYVGKILDHGEYEGLKKNLSSIAMRKGYFDSALTRHELGVSTELNKSIWNVDFNTGIRYRFGRVHFNNSQILDRYLDNIIPFKQGDYYTSEQLAKLNSQLSATNWFRSIAVAPRFEDVGEDKELPFEVDLVPRKRNSVEMGLGYSTGIGPRAKIAWNKPWINSRGHSFESNVAVSQYEQELAMQYKMPLSKSPLIHYYTLQGGFKLEDYKDTKSDSYTLNLTRFWDFPEHWKRSVGVTMNYDRFTQANIKHNTFLLYPTATISRLRSDGKLMPMWGDYQQYSINFATRYLMSDIDLWTMQAQNTWIRSLTPTNHRVILRAMYGYINASDFEKVPPSMRFFAGGDRSIRGYGYKSISPKDDDGKLIGGNRLLTGSMEYQYNTSGPWWVAAFVDSGQSVDKFNKNDFKTGTGVGIRWSSPVGPIKLDIAIPLNRHKKTPQFYIGLGPEL